MVDWCATGGWFGPLTLAVRQNCSAMKIPLVSIVLSLYCHLGMSQVVYEQAPSLSYLLTSDPSSDTNLAYSHEGLIADDFQFSRITAITTIRWWGSYNNHWPGQFQLALWRDAGHQPGSLISELQMHSPQEVPTGRTFFSGTYDEYYYQAVLETPFIAQPQVHYWLSIGDATSVASGNWRWESGSGSMYPGAWQSNGGIWNQQRPGQDMAFELDGLSIETPPHTQTAEVGSSASFFVRANGSPSLGYEWFFNSTNLVGFGTSPTLLLTNLSPSQVGTYAVVATNFMGAVTSAPAMLSLIPPVPRETIRFLTLKGQPGTTLNIQSAASLASLQTWTPVAAVALSNSSQIYWDISPAAQGFYRAWQSVSAGPPANLDIGQVARITLSGAIGEIRRLDYINRFGPTDAWVNLASVTLTNTSQFYFDFSAFGQPLRLYRVTEGP